MMQVLGVDHGFELLLRVLDSILLLLQFRQEHARVRDIHVNKT
jgi:hypothetical protein